MPQRVSRIWNDVIQFVPAKLSGPHADSDAWNVALDVRETFAAVLGGPARYDPVNRVVSAIENVLQRGVLPMHAKTVLPTAKRLFAAARSLGLKWRTMTPDDLLDPEDDCPSSFIMTFPQSVGDDLCLAQVLCIPTNEFRECLSATSTICVELERYDYAIRNDPWVALDGRFWFCGEYIWTSTGEETKLCRSYDIEQAVMGAARVRREQSRRLRRAARYVSAQELSEISDDIRDFVYERDNYECQQCGSRQSLHIDHIVPASLGGKPVPSNLHVLCASCNLAKGKSI